MTIPADDAPVVDDTATGRFLIRGGGTEAELIYAVDGDRMFLVHTEVPDEWGGPRHRGPAGPHRPGPGRGQRPDRGALVPLRPALAAGAPRRGGQGDDRLGDATSPRPEVRVGLARPIRKV